MKKTVKSPIVISVGGSLIVPDKIDTEFLKEIKKVISNEIKNGNRFIIICGGGKTARYYQQAGELVTKLRKDEVDWLGIHSTRLNAQLVKTILLPDAEEVIIKHPITDKVSFKRPVLIAAGWKPGRSTDYIAVLLAKRFKAKRLLNLSNIDYVYDSDPRENPNAKRIEKISWKEFRKIIPKKWDPGLSSPFDPIASKEAQSLGIEVAVLNGKNIEAIKKAIQGDDFIGTLISH
jgi:uridylate kinase